MNDKKKKPPPNILPKPLPCPFCGGAKIGVSGDDIQERFMTCENAECRAWGPCRATKRAAIEAWNQAQRTES